MQNIEIVGVVVLCIVLIALVGSWFTADPQGVEADAQDAQDAQSHARGRCPFSDLPWNGHAVSNVDEPGWYYCGMQGVMTNEAGEHLETVENIQSPHDCASRCDARGGCNGYEYVAWRQECHLKQYRSARETLGTLSRQPQYTFGIKRALPGSPEYDSVPYRLAPNAIEYQRLGGTYYGARDTTGNLVDIAALAGRYTMAGWPSDHYFTFGTDGRRVDDPTAKLFEVRDNLLTYIELPDTSMVVVYDPTSQTITTAQSGDVLFTRVPD